MHLPPKHIEEQQNAIAARVPSLGLGFEKVALDAAIHRRLLDHFHANARNFRAESEPGTEDILLRTENDRAHPALLFFDEAFNQALMQDLKPRHEAWSGMPLENSACYGIRVYQSGSYLYNHVDHTNTHVVSSTICVDHRLNSPWPLYIEDHDGIPHEISIEPGEMVFYESAKLVHGRPYTMDGDFYASIFVHYRPLDWAVPPEGSLAG